MTATTHYKDWPNDAGFNTEIEHRDPIALEVTGTIPAYAAGTLLRTGPGSHKLATKDGEFACSHWFDGFAHLYRFELVPTDVGNCKVLYSSRRQVDQLIERVRKTGRLDGITFGQKRDPCDTLFKKIKTKQNAGVSISANVGGFLSAKEGSKANLVTFTDAAVMKTHDPETLAPLGVTDQTTLHPSLTGEISCAHPEFDPETGDVFNYNLKLGSTPVYRVFCTSAATGKTTILAKLSGKDAKAAYLHSFFLTQNFIILCIWPSHFQLGGAGILWRRNILDALAEFDSSAKTKWFVIDRRHSTGIVAMFESSAIFAFHSVNAYETAGKDGAIDIVCDVVQLRNLDILKKFYYDNMVSSAPAADKRGFDLVDGKDGMARYKLSGIPAARNSPARAMRRTGAGLPTINPAYHTKPHRYIYGVGDRRQSSFHDSLVKMDTATQTAETWSAPAQTPGEPIFVADPTKEKEDEGVVLSVVLDGLSGHSYLLGGAEVPVAVGFGFHGTHVKL
ncbi:carotenoid oxygenase [Mycena alexandri]|uniref:Carotenoid oxygenase n=1 Tax=Mycena alexandri TaxID=1745969 RepID=A0AAD6T2K5_9AGAR|nr:carotenoid oxygenase [Mycena alexandri]